MKTPKFSVILPVYSELDPIQGGASSQRHFRGKTVQRAIQSIRHQQFPDWELIIVDDGCCDGITPAILDKFVEHDERIKVIHTENGNRAIALNKGMDIATGEWLCWLDSDDEYCSHYLREMDIATKDFPEYKIFNHGAILYWPDHKSTIRPTFYPSEEGKGHEWFKSGYIGAGSFVFRRDLWNSKKEYRIPDEANPYQFAADSHFDMQLPDDFPDVDNPTGAFTDGVKRHGFSLGNPWGQDFLQFYRLTRDNHSKPLDILLYIQYPRAHEGVYHYFGELFDTGVEE